MKPFFIILLCFLSILNIEAQAPDWSVNTRAYEFSMSFTAVLNVNGNRLTSTNDQVAAFVDNEIRGTGKVSYVAEDDKYVVFFRVYANTTGETINFKIYDSANNVVVNVPKTTNFQIDARVGGVFQSYSIASPTLGSEANLIDFSFQGITEISKSQNGTAYTFLLPQGTDVTSLKPEFTISENARLFKNFVKQESGVSIQDFSNEVVYTVLSPDESTTLDYSISVTVSGGSGSITTTLDSDNSSITKNTTIELSLTTNVAIVELNKADFNLTNCVVKSITEQNSQEFTIEIVLVNQGNVSIQVKENSLLDVNGNTNVASNVFEFLFDSIAPVISSITRTSPLEKETGANSVTFTITFSEAVENVSFDDFQTVENATITVNKQTNTVYTVVVTNIDEFEGTVSVSSKIVNNITDLASNTLRISNSLDF